MWLIICSLFQTCSHSPSFATWQMCWVLTRSWWMSVYLKLKWSLCVFIELQSPETSFSLFRAWTDYLGSRKSRIQERCVSDWLVKGSRVGCGRREICASSRSIYMLWSWSVPPKHSELRNQSDVLCALPKRFWNIVDCLSLCRYTWSCKRQRLGGWTCWFIRVHACMYQFAWKSHVTLKRILFVVVEFVNFMYLFSSLGSSFRIRMLQCFDHLPDLYTVVC